MFNGSTDEISAEVEAFMNAGVEYIVFDPETESDSETVDMIGILSEAIINRFK